MQYKKNPLNIFLLKAFFVCFYIFPLAKIPLLFLSPYPKSPPSFSLYIDSCVFLWYSINNVIAGLIVFLCHCRA